MWTPSVKEEYWIPPCYVLPFYTFFFFAVLGIEPKALNMLGKGYTNRPHLELPSYVFLCRSVATCGLWLICEYDDA
jgi:hypothetical protein